MLRSSVTLHVSARLPVELKKSLLRGGRTVIQLVSE